MATTNWVVVHPPDFWAFGLAYLNDIDHRIKGVKDHSDRYYVVSNYQEYVAQFGQLVAKVNELVEGDVDPVGLPPASKLVYYEGTSILRPIDLNKPDYRRLPSGEFSAIYRLDYSQKPHVCFGVRIFFRVDDFRHMEAALEALYQQILKRMSG